MTGLQHRVTQIGQSSRQIRKGAVSATPKHRPNGFVRGESPKHFRACQGSAHSRCRVRARPWAVSWV